jgi:hypothetical protein
MRLTSKTYTDAGLLPVADAVLKLPSLTRKKPADSQDLFRAGQDQSSQGTDALRDTTQNYLVARAMDKKKSAQSRPVKNWEMVRGTGFEPVTSRV